MSGSAALGVIMVGVAGFVGFEALKHFQGSTTHGSTGTSSSNGSSGVPAGSQTTVVPSTGSFIGDARAFAAANGVDPAPILAIVQFESQGSPTATNPDCKGDGSYDTVCRGYLQVNERVYGPAPSTLAGQLAITGIGDRIVGAIKKYGAGWRSNFLTFWAEAQGGYSNGNPNDQLRAQQAIAYGLQNA